jgi:hypothetical protein
MSARSLSAKMAKSASSLGSGEGSSVMDMVLMGAGVAVIILLLVYIYNRFIQKQPAKNEYFGLGPIDHNNNECICGKQVIQGEVSCVKCRYGTNKDGTCARDSG